TVVAFPQILDFTTDTNSADWSDLDPDGCCLAGSGPSSEQACAFGGGSTSGLSSTGTCLDSPLVLPPPNAQACSLEGPLPARQQPSGSRSDQSAEFVSVVKSRICGKATTV